MINEQRLNIGDLVKHDDFSDYLGIILESRNDTMSFLVFNLRTYKEEYWFQENTTKVKIKENMFKVEGFDLRYEEEEKRD